MKSQIAIYIMRCCFVYVLATHPVLVGGTSENPKICGRRDRILNGTELISSPGYPEPSNRGIECNWRISNPTGKAVFVRGITLDVGSELRDCRKGSLEIFNGCGSDRFLVEKICSSRFKSGRKGFLWVSSGPCVALKYSSGYASEKLNKFRLSLTESAVSCGGVLPNEANNHTFGGSLPANPGNRDCVWIIAVPRGKIELVFKDRFQVTSQGQDCKEDFVKVQDGRYSSSPLLGTYCGTSRPYPVYSSGRYLRVTLHGSTNGLAAKHSFIAQYNVVDSRPTAPTGICDGDIFLDSADGVVQTPRYSEQYPAELHCIWKIQVAENNKIILRFRDFDVEGDSQECHDHADYAKVYNGLASWSPIFGRYCGSDIPPSITSESNKLRIEFLSNNQYAGRGFDAVYSVDGASPGDATGNHFTAIMIGTTCGIIFVVLSILAVFHTRKLRIQRALIRRPEGASTLSLSFDVHQANAPPSYETVMASPDMFPSNSRQQSSRGYSSLPHLHREISHLLGEPESDDEDLPPYPGLSHRDGVVEFLPGRPSQERRRSSSKERRESESDNPFQISAVWYRRWPTSASSSVNVGGEGSERLMEGSENQARTLTLERRDSSKEAPRPRLERMDTSSSCTTDV